MLLFWPATRDIQTPYSADLETYCVRHEVVGLDSSAVSHKGGGVHCTAMNLS